ncbi:MAG TPA: NUDIX domain-containing protein [Saprospiraceae bacterium]|nr:NUDIX domain-containing protein [Saprospiraceae bacterium]HRP42240.1 NUDIX domain-containing protein [Saprospiraceae bacterium]
MQYNNRVKIIRESILYQGWSTLIQYVIDYIRSDQHTETLVREIYDSGDGVVVLLYNSKTDKILLIRQFRLPVYLNGHPTGFILECCAGLLDHHQPESTAKKEIEEETGYRLQNIHKIYEAFATPGAHKEKIHYYYGLYDEQMQISQGGGLITENEDIEIIEYPYSQIPELLKSGAIIDSKTIILLQWALLNKSVLLT